VIVLGGNLGGKIRL